MSITYADLIVTALGRHRRSVAFVQDGRRLTYAAAGDLVGHLVLLRRPRDGVRAAARSRARGHRYHEPAHARLRGLADVAGTARGGAGADRAGLPAVLRADGVGRAGDGAVAARPRPGGARPAHVLRQARGKRAPTARGRRRRAGGRRGRRRDLPAGPRRDGRLLAPAGADGRDAARRLAAHRRHGRARRRRVPHDRGSQEGHGRLRRLQRLPARDRGRPQRASGCWRSSRDRRSRRQVGRGRQGDRRPATGCRGVGRRARRRRAGAQGSGVRAQVGRLRRRDSAHAGRQGRQARSAPATAPASSGSSTDAPADPGCGGAQPASGSGRFAARLRHPRSTFATKRFGDGR
jgi:hypothetical protein